MVNQFVIFSLAGEQYGVDISNVESIIKMQEITPVPHAPDFVEGVTNLRGKVLPVMDLRKRYGLEQREFTLDTRIVVVETDGAMVGMIVDEVHEVLSVSEDSIEPPASIVTTLDSGSIDGIAKVDDRLIILLDLRKVLSLDEKATLQASVA